VHKIRKPLNVSYSPHYLFRYTHIHSLTHLTVHVNTNLKSNIGTTLRCNLTFDKQANSYRNKAEWGVTENSQVTPKRLRDCSDGKGGLLVGRDCLMDLYSFETAC